MEQILKDYFTYNEEEKERIINEVFDGLIEKAEHLSNELGTDVLLFYKRNYHNLKDEALKNENYEMCEVIDKLLNLIDNHANTRKKTK
jgi:hypothetical protein